MRAGCRQSASRSAIGLAGKLVRELHRLVVAVHLALAGWRADQEAVIAARPDLDASIGERHEGASGAAFPGGGLAVAHPPQYGTAPTRLSTSAHLLSARPALPTYRVRPRQRSRTRSRGLPTRSS